MCEIREPHQLIANYARKTSRFLMRQFEELVEQAELADDLERRGMNGIAAENRGENPDAFQGPPPRHRRAQVGSLASFRRALRQRCSNRRRKGFTKIPGRLGREKVGIKYWSQKACD